MAFHFGLLGGTIDYSKSPAIFEVIFAQSGIRGRFDLFPTMPPALPQRVKQIVDDGVTGLSVTIPFKSAIIPLLSELDQSAKMIGAVNSVHFNENGAIGYNTDGDGFSATLVPHAKKLAGTKALILGSGGASRSVMHTLYWTYGLREFAVMSQSVADPAGLCGSIADFAPEAKVTCLNRADKHWPVIGKVSLIVNCTPLGGPLHPRQQAIPTGFPWPSDAIYYDLNYNDDNASVQAARKHASVVIDGRRMLIAQAVRSFKIWSGLEVDPKPIYEKIFGRT